LLDRGPRTACRGPVAVSAATQRTLAGGAAAIEESRTSITPATHNLIAADTCRSLRSLRARRRPPQAPRLLEHLRAQDRNGAHRHRQPCRAVAHSRRTEVAKAAQLRWLHGAGGPHESRRLSRRAVPDLPCQERLSREQERGEAAAGATPHGPERPGSHRALHAGPPCPAGDDASSPRTTSRQSSRSSNWRRATLISISGRGLGGDACVVPLPSGKQSSWWDPRARMDATTLEFWRNLPLCDSDWPSSRIG